MVSGPTEDSDSTEDMGELLDSLQPVKPLRRGDVVEGVVMRADPGGILLNIGHKAEGHVPPGEMRTLTREGQESPNIGDEIVAYVVKGETPEEPAILSIDKAVGEQGWRVLEKALESKQSLTGRIQEFNRGGAIVEVEGVQGFVPISQLISISRSNFWALRDAHERKAEADQADPTDGTETAESDGEATEATSENDQGGEQGPSEIGKELELKVLEVNRSRNRAIFSERQAIQAQREERKAELIQELAEGEVRKGQVTGISSFGAFVDLGGADGLVHISELSWSPVRSPEEVVKLGQEVDVYVLRVDSENNKIALSIKRLQREPWETITERYQVGDIVDATVTKLTDFGAFARVEGSVEGLIHVSELAARPISHPGDVVREGDAVRLKILRIEPERRRLGLSLREAQDDEEEREAEEDEQEQEQEQEGES